MFCLKRQKILKRGDQETERQTTNVCSYRRQEVPTSGVSRESILESPHLYIDMAETCKIFPNVRVTNMQMIQPYFWMDFLKGATWMIVLRNSHIEGYLADYNYTLNASKP